VIQISVEKHPWKQQSCWYCTYQCNVKKQSFHWWFHQNKILQVAH